MTKAGWFGEDPDAEGVAMPVTAMLLANRERRGSPMETALARSAAADVRQAREEAEAVRDPDEAAAAMVNRGYTPGLVSSLHQQRQEKAAELETERALIAKGELETERVRGLLARGQIGGLAAHQRMDGDFGDAERAAKLERQIARLDERILEAAAMIAPPQERDPDPVAAASRAAHDEFVRVTRAMLDGSRPVPREPRPFGSVSRAAGRSTEHTGPDCWVCAEGRKRDAATQTPGPDITRARLEDLGHGESSPDGCPPCDACHYVACRCSPYPRAAGEPQVYA